MAVTVFAGYGLQGVVEQKSGGALISFGDVWLLALSDALAMHPNLRD
jgi:hypothetical protein